MTISLGTAANFALLAKTAIYSTGPTKITGDIGIYPGKFYGGKNSIKHIGETHISDSTASTAMDDITNVYNITQSLTPTQDLSSKVLGNRGTVPILTPGVYKFTGSTHVAGRLILDGNGEYVFQISGSFTMSPNSAVVLANGSNMNQVFWNVGGTVTLKYKSDIVGNVLAGTSITANKIPPISTTEKTIFRGRLFAKNGAISINRVTGDNNS